MQLGSFVLTHLQPVLHRSGATKSPTGTAAVSLIQDPFTALQSSVVMHWAGEGWVVTEGWVGHCTGGGGVVHCTGWLVEQGQEGGGVVVQPQEWLVGGLWSEYKLKPFAQQGRFDLRCTWRENRLAPGSNMCRLSGRPLGSRRIL